MPSAPDSLPAPGAPSAPGVAPGATRPIRFWHRGRLQQVADLPATLTVLQWLREHQRCTGTKEGCNEGDCGACTVLVGELDTGGDAGHGAHGARLRITPRNSCLLLLPMLDGKALITVEDLGGQHPAQQALVAQHGSQCGFCTPGFVMTLAGCYARQVALGEVASGAAQSAQQICRPSRQQLADDLSGNLCRCTGYRPILDAGQQMFDTPPQGALGPALPVAPIVSVLQGLAGDAPLQLAGDTPYAAPRRLPDLAAQLLAWPQARLLAGNTDIGLWINKQFKTLPALVWLGEVAELQAITEHDGNLHIGAGATLQAAWAALARHWPELREMGLRFASWPVREAGTLGGNLANGSPIGDGAPVLMALGARLLLRRGDQQRHLPLDVFYLGYQRNALAPGEFVQAIELPLPRASQSRQTQRLRAYKLSKRFDSDISAVACGLWLRLDDGRIAEARLAFGGLAATVQRAAHAEAALTGQPWTEATLRSAQAALASDFSPLSDHRASAGYRQRAAGNLLRRFWLETRPDAPLPADQVSVWARP